LSSFLSFVLLSAFLLPYHSIVANGLDLSSFANVSQIIGYWWRVKSIVSSGYEQNSQAKRVEKEGICPVFMIVHLYPKPV
jgi:hypothetical protein